MACPICVSPEGTAITAGIRAGAGLLVFVTVVVIGLIARFGYRLWAAEGAHNAEHSVPQSSTFAKATVDR